MPKPLSTISSGANLIQLKFSLTFTDTVAKRSGTVLRSVQLTLEMVMDKIAFALAIATSILPGTGHAQEKEDMTQLTCTNYLMMSPDLARIYSA